MSNIVKFIKEKGKIVVIPVVIVAVLVSIYIFNGYKKNDTTVIKTEEGTYIEASGMVESNFINISSETQGTVIEAEVEEGDKLKSGQVIAKINNTNILNQYEQAKFNMEIAEKNVVSIEDSIENLSIQNNDLVNQAKSAYLSTEGEYENIVNGASAEEIEQVEETVNQARINLEYADTNFNRSKELFEQGVIPESQFEEAEKNYNLATAQYNGANSKLSLIKAGATDATLKATENRMLQAKAGYELAISNGNAQIRQLQSQLEIAKIQLEQSKRLVAQSKTELDKTIIKSPIDGVVNLLTFKPGEFVPVGKQVAEIYDPSNVEVKVYVSEANIGHIKVGQEVDIFVDSHGNEKFGGKVTKINNKAEFTPKNIQTKEERVNTVFEVKIEVLDSDGVIKPGMPVDVNIKID